MTAKEDAITVFRDSMTSPEEQEKLQQIELILRDTADKYK